MDDLVKSLSKIDQIVIMGNSPHINHLKYDLIDQMVSIGVNRIGFVYHPNVLLWTDCALFTSDWEAMTREYRGEYHNILKATKADVKICRKNEYALKVPGCIQFETVKDLSHNWKGGLIDFVSVCTAIHLAMVARIKKVFVAGVDMASNNYAWGSKQYGSDNGEFKKIDRDLQFEQFETIRKVNTECEILLCSPKSNIPGFKKTEYLNAKSLYS